MKTKTVKVKRQTHPVYDEYGYIIGYDNIEELEYKLYEWEIVELHRRLADDESVIECTVWIE